MEPASLRQQARGGQDDGRHRLGRRASVPWTTTTFEAAALGQDRRVDAVDGTNHAEQGHVGRDGRQVDPDPEEVRGCGRHVRLESRHHSIRRSILFGEDPVVGVLVSHHEDQQQAGPEDECRHT